MTSLPSDTASLWTLVLKVGKFPTGGCGPILRRCRQFCERFAAVTSVRVAHGFEERVLCHFKVLLLLLGHPSFALPVLQLLLTDKPRAVLLSKAAPDKG